MTMTAGSFPYSREATLDGLFAAQVARSPRALAVLAGPRSLTYRELDQRSSALAAHLRLQGVTPESRVGLAMERSAEMMVALLGILRAGGAYVPLDPSYPRERLRLMLEDAGIEILLAHRDLAQQLPDSGARNLLWEELEGTLDDAPETPVASGTTADSLAYIMYTSGSTGRPKGVAVPHRGVVRLVIDNPFAEMSAEQVFLQAAPVSFDASTFEIWGALLHGARLALLPPGPLSLADLGRTLRREAVTTLWLTSGLFHQMVDDHLEDLAGLEQLLAGGDVLSVPHVEKVRRRFPGCRLINGYGPTESTTFTTCHTLRADEPLAGSVPIGRPIARTEVVLLDDELASVAPGEVGEIYIGGDGLARGYFGQPGLTADRFVPHPQRPAERLYRTGDLAQRDESGVLRFLGRRDDQVKVRGFRIELGEIEAVLAGHPDVRRAAVAARPDATGNKRLDAYVIARPGAAPGSRDLRTYLAARLPEHMLPGTFTVLDELPLGATGKVDRKALPEPTLRGADAAGEAPRSEVEKAVAGLLAELLGIGSVALDDDLFELGGHSLLATRLVTRLRDLTGSELPMAEVFADPTARGIARLLEAGGRSQEPQSIPRASRDGDLPLSSAQQRVWFLTQLQPDSLAYNYQGSLRFSGPLQPRALEQALNEIVRRHEILRTTFPSKGGDPVQKIHPYQPFDLARVDLSSLPADSREAELDSQIGELLQQPFDLTQLPLVRWTLFRLADDDHVLLQLEHHLVHDGWSFNVFLEELAAAYRAYATGTPPQLPELPVQFADFAAWQQAWTEGPEAERQLDYWARRLADGPEQLALPYDRPRPSRQSFRGSSLRMELPPALAHSLRELARQHSSTLFMTLLAAFLTLLSRYSGQTDIQVGCGIANRRRRETERLIGMIINTVVLRHDLGGDPTFLELLAQVKEVTREAYAHQDLPFEKVVEALRPERSLSHNPFFQTAFSFHDAPLRSEPLPGLTTETTVGLSNGSAKFDLNVIGIPTKEQRLGQGEEGSEAIEMIWEYSSDLFDRATVEAMVEHFQTLLAGIVEEPRRRLSELPLLSPGETRRILVDWNDTATTFPRESSIPQLVAEWVAETPEACAVVDGETQLTYRELDERSLRLARQLRHRGVGPEVLVGISIERSAQAVVALLGILRSGAAYLPLDPAYPQERLAFMLQDAGAPLVLTRGDLRDALPETGPEPGFEVLLLEDLEASSETDLGGGDLPPEDLWPSAGSEQLAYVIYTSGSTGTPKGVAVSHRNISRLVRGTSYVSFEPEDAVLQFAPIPFDASTFEIWGPLANGGKLVIAPPGPLSLSALSDLVQRQKVRALFLTTALFNQLMEESPRGLRGVRQLLTGGEAASPEHFRKAQRELPTTELSNIYGPTEGTTFSSWHPLDPTAEVPASLPIGRPIANARLYVLDASLRPVPPGAPGELFIGGEGLARGYLRRPALTAERFVPDAFSGEAGGRLYRTGDLVRWRREGTVEFLGRLDHQVKIRGFRIEPGEVEAVLGQHPGVREVAVVVRQDQPGELRLVAYAVAAQNGLTAADLRGFLETRLPAYMVPSAFVLLDAFPLSPSGKIDRKALPEPSREGDADRGAFVEPRTPVEACLGQLWEDLLGIERVGALDHFFDIGGHSLHATRFIARLSEALGAEVLPVSTLYESPSLESLARRLEEGLSEEQLRRLLAVGPLSKVGAIPRRTQGGRAPLSWSQELFFFVETVEGVPSVYRVSRLFPLEGRVDEETLRQSLRYLAERHDILRTRFVALSQTETYQEVDPDCDLDMLEVIDLRSLPAKRRQAEAKRVVGELSKRPFDLARPPLMRAALLRLGDTKSQLLLQMHHMIVDEWAFSVLCPELSACYAAFSEGREPELPELSIQYSDYAAWEKEWLQGEVLEKLLAYWGGILPEGPPKVLLRTDRPRPAAPGFQGALCATAAPPSLTEALKRLGREEGATLFMVLLSAYMVLLHQHSGQSDLAVGCPNANRLRVQAESLLGCFMNMLILRSDLSGDPSLREVLRRVRQAALDAYSHQQLPFLLAAMNFPLAEPIPNRGPLQALFTFQATATMELRLGDAKAGPPRVVDRGATDIDLSLTIQEKQGELQILLLYDTELFDATTADGMLDDFLLHLHAFAETPDRPLREVTGDREERPRTGTTTEELRAP